MWSMQPEPRRQETTSPIRVSEIGQWVYCNLAWKFQRQGAVSTPEAAARAEEGITWHAQHGDVVTQSIRARRFRNWCLVLATGVAMMLATLWVTKL